MKIRKTGLAINEPLNPPRMIGGVKRDSYAKVVNVDVVRVDELVAWCNANPDVAASTLATSLENGVFA